MFPSLFDRQKKTSTRRRNTSLAVRHNFVEVHDEQGEIEECRLLDKTSTEGVPRPTEPKSQLTVVNQSFLSRQSNQNFCFEEDISSFLIGGSATNVYEDDGNEKKRKTFILRQRLEIAFQPWIVRWNTFGCTPKDAAIVVLLILLLLLLASTRSGGNVERSASKLPSRAVYPSQHVSTPKRYDTLADVTEALRTRDTPVFFHVPRSAGITLQDILSHCWNLVEASQVGTTHGHDQDEELRVWQHEDGGRYVNVDTTTLDGIERAKRLRLAQSGLADFVYSSYLYDVGGLFTHKYRGRMFALFRHPIDRAVSMYYYLQDAVTRGEVSSQLLYPTIADYAKSEHMENNLITRLLVNKIEGPLEPEDLDQAKEILRRKCVVGLTSQFGQSLERFKYYFGWHTSDERSRAERVRILQCEERLVEVGDNRHTHPNIEKGGEPWNLLLEQNVYDMQLYQYAKAVFDEQGVQLFEVERPT